MGYVKDAQTESSITDEPGLHDFRLDTRPPGTDFTLTERLEHNFSALGTQVVRVPEFTTVNIPAGSSLRPAHLWASVVLGFGPVSFLPPEPQNLNECPVGRPVRNPSLFARQPANGNTLAWSRLVPEWLDCC